MKKIILSTTAILSILTTNINANTDADIVQMQETLNTMNQRLTKLEAENATLKDKKIKKHTIVKSKVPLLKISGKDYLGFVSSKDGAGAKSNYFESRRNYIQIKGYFSEESKSYFRITLDTFQNTRDDGKDAGSWEVRLKYAYLYLDDILPFTGVEFGQVHRPWIDYEEHGGWNYRSISKVFVEATNGAHLTNSADLGINFKTKTDYFSSELGLFNGEGYHGVIENDENINKLSAEWRLTGHILGGGTHKAKKTDTYANVSFFGQWNAKSNKHGGDLNWYGAHAVYNQSAFLLSAQYIVTKDAPAKYAGKGYSFNGSYRFDNQWGMIGRYDYFEMDAAKSDKYAGDKKRTLAGVTYQYNKYVEFVANYLKEDGTALTETKKQDAFMFTAEVNW